MYNSSLAQLVEQRTVNPCVNGSSPLRGATFIVLSFKTNSSLAQLVEQRTVNPCVNGSSPLRGATLS